jgi:undecaprenyl-diphosphatase
LVIERVAKKTRTLEEMTLRDGLIIGAWQVLALIPGSSRSGTTLSGGLSLGFTREAAARYSFLLSIPATGAAGLFELKHLVQATERPGYGLLAVGTVVSFCTGLLAIHGLLRFLRKRSTMVFIVYRVLAGAALLALLATGGLHP